MSRRPVLVSIALLSSLWAGPSQTAPRRTTNEGLALDRAVPPVSAEAAPPPSPRLAAGKTLAPVLLGQKIKSYFAGQTRRRIYIQVDKPLYKPGETIWIKTWDLLTRDLSGQHANSGLQYELISPKGSLVESKRVQERQGMATNDFALPDGLEGGQYTIRVRAFDGVEAQRFVIVQSYEAPRLKQKLEFVRKAYGPGDEVRATLSVKRATGAWLSNHPLEGLVVLDGAQLAPIRAQTDALGKAELRFTLPAQIARGDGILTVLVQDGGVTESVSKRVPIVLKRLQLAVYPEGGALVAGLPSRLYFEAQNMLGKPADIEGRIVDDAGKNVATLRSTKFGFGRTAFTPARGRRYQIAIDKPADVTERYPLPAVLEQGCVLRTFDDIDGQRAELRVAVRCSERRRVTVVGMQRDALFDTATVQVDPGRAARVYLQAARPALAWAPGVARVTVFDEQEQPLAERVVFRNRRNQLVVRLETRSSYAPRERMSLSVRTLDRRGQPVPAEVAISVVDDTVLSFADDKTAHMLPALLLLPEITGELEEPNFFFDLTKDNSGLALELLMGTRGFRRFEWVPLLQTEVSRHRPGDGRGQGYRSVITRTPRGGAARSRRAFKGDDRADRDEPSALGGLAAAPRPASPPPAMPARPAAEPAPRMEGAAKAAGRALPPAPAPAQPPAEAAQPVLEAKKEIAAGDAEMEEQRRADVLRDDRAPARARRRAPAGWPRGLREQAIVAGWAPVRVFPAPSYSGKLTGPRTDFRDTVFWAPSVRTGASGQATVKFSLSDAVTSFRIVAEAAGGRRVGRAEKVFKSSLPFSLAAKLPLQVSAGDQIELPITFTNERDEALPFELRGTFGQLIVPRQPVALRDRTLGPRGRESAFFALDVRDGWGKNEVRLAARGGGLEDELIREIDVVPLGFPQSSSESGTLAKQARIELDLGQALPGSARGRVTLYPSPTATLLAGLDGMIQEPYGCFEQTSSTNYPNVMVLDYLRTNQVASPALGESTRAKLDSGYKRLVGFETKEKGYEWFGSVPAHEALSAYGLLEFVDMQRVHGGVDPAMLQRTVAYLRGRRDGKGGFLRDAKALDSFGRAKPEVTNAYIVYALTEAGVSDLGPELEQQVLRSKREDDPYLLAVAVNALLNVPARRQVALEASRRLATMQHSEGYWDGKDHSITRSTGENLRVETTGFALLALMESGVNPGAVMRGVKWLVNARQGYGAWGATQATVLALKALTEYAKRSRKTQSSGDVIVRVNGREVARHHYAAGATDPIVVDTIGGHLRSGKNSIELAHVGKDELPFTASVEYRSTRPANHPAAVVGLSTELRSSTLRMGQTVRLVAHLRNKTSQGQPMTLARIGIPGGLTHQSWQLKELVESKQIAFYETGPREVILYFRDLAPSATRDVPIELVANVPGTYTAPASSAYLYYTNDQKVWAAPARVTVSR